ncbi:uncharacterized protein LOC126690281 [Quercus robur]|uniref:uncharacterized protein LOC126690281 n=1 Tax=Quercus robur TaxID=38942 RepID=UPI0021613BC0|nr:uncharacterized protein LOC126690281 [Quercus robur]
MRDVYVDLSINQVYRAKRKAREFILGDERLQYGKLRDYAEMIKVTDVGSKVILQTEITEPNTQPKFKRMYVRYNAQKVGFLGGVQATCVVEQENKDSWVWFLQTFADDIGRQDELNLVFISNRQKGLIPAMEMLLPTVEHRFCVKHIYNNFKVNFKGLELKVALWSESFNSMILEVRDKPIIAMREWIRVRLMTRMYSKRSGIEKFTSDICPNIVQKLEQLKVDSKLFSAIPSRCYIYEVDNEYERHVVNLIRKCCTCRVWDLTGIPCKHGIAAIYKNLERPKDYVHACFRKDAYVAAYKEMITLLLGQDEWVETNLLAPVAPIVYKPTSRPSMKMKKDANEPNNPYTVSRSYRPIKCGFCYQEGHNSRRCKAGITGETSWQRR